jgi:putative PIN family toxin of toxin-antitoxin system
VADEPLPPLRVVLDTNVLVSALLFRQGRLSWIRCAWKNPPAGRKLTPLLGPATTLELIRVLAYPKFQLTQGEVNLLLAEILPFAETVPVNPPILSGLPELMDAADRIFLDLAIGSAADVLVSGDADLLVLAGELEGLAILSPAEFEGWWKAESEQSSPG